MGYNHFRYARRIDADTIGFYHEDMTKLLTLDKATASVTQITGQDATAKDLLIKANATDARPSIRLDGASRIQFIADAQMDYNIGAVHIMRVKAGGDNSGLSLHIKETTTPGALADFGALYTKADNELYFQTGAGVEKTVTTV